MTRFGQEHFNNGAARALARLLEKRFGAVPSVVRERIFSADLASLDAWLDRAIDAPDLQSVLGLN